MIFNSGLTTLEVMAAFADEVADRGGRVTDTYEDGRRLFARSILRESKEVRLGDEVQNGIALKATDEGLWVYPYVLRLVCRNGAVMPQTIDEQFVENLAWQDPDAALESLREAVRCSSATVSFTDNVRKMRQAIRMDADIAIFLQVSQHLTAAHPDLMAQIMGQFAQSEDRSQFGLANAVTATARDTRDPELRWNLEELGGAMAINMPLPNPLNGQATVSVPENDALEVS
jgi:hypothetical protein